MVRHRIGRSDKGGIGAQVAALQYVPKVSDSESYRYRKEARSADPGGRRNHGHQNAPSCARLRFCIRGRRCADLGLRGSVLMQCGPQGRCRPRRRASRYPCCLSPANSSVPSSPLLRAPAAWLWSGRGLSIATGCIFVWGVAQQNETPNSLPGKVDHLHFFTQRLMTIVIGRGAPIDQ
jgi:hypothetical protein